MKSGRIVVVGGGPAGVRASETLLRSGINVTLIDENARIGGQIYRQPPVGAERCPQDLYGTEATKAVAVHSSLSDFEGPNFDYRPRTLVWNIFQGALDLKSGENMDKLEYDRLLIATGAFDRVLPVPGWTTPGVFTLGAAQIALKAQGVAIGRDVALVGAGPLLPLVATQYLKAGGNVVAVIDVTPLSAKIAALPKMMSLPGMVLRGLSYLMDIKRRGAPMHYGVRKLSVEGDDCVTAISFETSSGQTKRVECDAVGMSFGLRSETQLADLAGCEFAFDTTLRQWLPLKGKGGRTTVENVYLAGDCSGIGGADIAELEGKRSAYAILEDMGLTYDRSRASAIDQELRRYSRFREGMEQAYPFPGHLLDQITDDVIVCRCEGIHAGALKQTCANAAPADVNRQKAFSRAGLGRCQGRVCGMAVAELQSRYMERPIEASGRMRGQPPVKPIAF